MGSEMCVRDRMIISLVIDSSSFFSRLVFVFISLVIVVFVNHISEFKPVRHDDDTHYR